MTSRRSHSWAILLAGIAVLLLAAWLVRRADSAATSEGAGARPPAIPSGAAAPTPLPSSQGSGPATAPPNPSSTPEPGWVAHWTIDGDTLDIAKDGQVVRLRLLNIDAPERRSVDHGPECLAERATARLIELAPRSMPLRVLTVGKDRYGRTLGEAWLADGRLLGAEIVRSGLAAPVTIGGQDRFRAEMDAARAEAAGASRGLHDPKENCSMPARIIELEGSLTGWRAQAPSAERDTLRADLASRAETLLADLTASRPRAGIAALTDAERDDLTTRVRAVASGLRQ